MCFQTEYMPISVGTKYLIDKKLLNLSIALTITLLYLDFDNELINELSDIYFSCKEQEKFIQKEVEHFLKEFILVSIESCLFSLIYISSKYHKLYCSNFIYTKLYIAAS